MRLTIFQSPYIISHDSGLGMLDLIDSPDQCQRTSSRPDLPPDNYPDASDVKHILALLVGQNLQLQTGTEAATLSVRVQSKIQDLLTEETCSTFAEHINTCKEWQQESHLAPDGISSVNLLFPV